MKIWHWILIIILVVMLIAAFLFGKGCGGEVHTVTIRDTTIIERVKYQESRDTVVKWYELTKTITRSDTVFEQKLDSVQIVKYYDRDLIPHLRKEGDVIILQTINFEGKVIREWRFDNIGRDFVITGVKDNVIVKKENFYLNGITLFGDAMFPARTKLQLRDLDYNVGLKGGVTFLDKVDLNLKTNYNFERENFTFGVETEIKLF